MHSFEIAYVPCISFTLVERFRALAEHYQFGKLENENQSDIHFFLGPTIPVGSHFIDMDFGS